MGRFLFFGGDADLGLTRVETALELAEALLLPEVMSQALNTKAIMLTSRDRSKEGLAVLRYALEVALEHDKPAAALRAYYNLADTLSRVDRHEEAAACLDDGITLARRVGNRYWEWNFRGQVYPAYALGRWDDVLAITSELPENEWLEVRQLSAGLAGIGCKFKFTAEGTTEARAPCRRLQHARNVGRRPGAWRLCVREGCLSPRARRRERRARAR